MIYGFYFICKLKKHRIITNIWEKAETLPSKVSVFCEKKESEKSPRKKMPKILLSYTSLVSTFIELSTNTVISILKSKVYGMHTGKNDSAPDHIFKSSNFPLIFEISAFAGTNKQATVR